jgi:hypothetical protein
VEVSNLEMGNEKRRRRIGLGSELGDAVRVYLADYGEQGGA